jgi:hypothetical protein
MTNERRRRWRRRRNDNITTNITRRRWRRRNDEWKGRLRRRNNKWKKDKMEEREERRLQQSTLLVERGTENDNDGTGWKVDRG